MVYAFAMSGSYEVVINEIMSISKKAQPQIDRRTMDLEFLNVREIKNYFSRELRFSGCIQR
jgi:hypothetical protein